jgi:hypothetical protein
MLAAYAEPKQTPFTIEELDRVISHGLSTILGKRPSIETRAVALAKVRLESGNGRFAWNFNIGNVKCPADVSGNFTCITLNEVLPKRGLVWFAPEGELVGGRGSALRYAPVPVPDGDPQTRMRSLAGPTDGGIFYVDFIFSKPRYAKAGGALLAGNPEAYSRELAAAGYYTAPVEQYTATVMSLYRESLARLSKQPYEAIEQPERAEWMNQLALDGFVAREVDRMLDEGPRAGRNLLDYEAE